MSVNHYDVCPRAPDLEDFHVGLSTLKARFEDHADTEEQRYASLALLLKEHNGYIRENQAFQNKILGGMLVIGAMSGLAAAFSILARVS